MREVALVRAIHLRKAGHVAEEHGALDHLGQVRPGLGQDRLDVLAARGRLHRDAAAHQLAGRVAGDLARDEDEAGAGCGDGLGLWRAERRGESC